MTREKTTHDVLAAVGAALRRRAPSAGEERVVLDRVWSDVRQRPEHMSAIIVAAAPRRMPATLWALAAAAVLVMAVGAAMLWRPADDALYRVVEGDVYQGETIRSNGGGGAVLALTDGSRIEMRSDSELSLERADDGVRVRLSRGGIIVNAAKQRNGHLYVQTRDIAVSVVGTVFVVDVEERGSRVAVLEGEVHVRHGAIDRNLLPGDEVTTNRPVTPNLSDEIAWSRNAERHRALLEQSTVTAPPARPASVSPEPPAAFETISIRPAPPGSIGARGRGGFASGGVSCAGVDLQVDPSRFAVRNIPLYGLISLAYGKECQPQVQHVGGPAWLRTDGYDVEATIPAGSPAFTARQLRNGMAPRLESMLQAMLADRFKLVLRREMREMSVYNLVVVAPGKLKPSADQNPPDRVPGTGGFTPMVGVVGPAIVLSSTPMSKFAGGLLQSLADRPVIDQTGLTGLFDVFLNWPALAGTSGADLETGMRDQLSSRLQEHLGLKLEPATGLVEVLVIERAERPTEN